MVYVSYTQLAKVLALSQAIHLTFWPLFIEVGPKFLPSAHAKPSRVSM